GTAPASTRSRGPTATTCWARSARSSPSCGRRCSDRPGSGSASPGNEEVVRLALPGGVPSGCRSPYRAKRRNQRVRFDPEYLVAVEEAWATRALEPLEQLYIDYWQSELHTLCLRTRWKENFEDLAHFWANAARIAAGWPNSPWGVGRLSRICRQLTED